MNATGAQRGHAIVIGGSIAGLLSARVLADHFQQVTVVERDKLLDSPEPRRAVPQANHVHVLLRQGRMLLQQLFPGFAEELAEAGAPEVDWTADLATYTPAGHAPRFPSGLTTRTCSRGLLEYRIRRRVAADPKVTLLPEHEVSHLLPNSDRTRVIGVETGYRGEGEGSHRTSGPVQGDLVVDASGRSSRLPDWLGTLGYEQPQETVVNSFLGYATREYQFRAGFSPGWKVLFVRSRPPLGTRGGVVFPIENGRWLVNLAGAGVEVPPTDPSGFLEFARELIHPALYDAIVDAEPVGKIAGYRRTENRFRRYDAMKRQPEGLIVLGDAVCGLNPLYGQGMTVAAMEALALGRWLARGSDCLAFQRDLARVVRTPWLMATMEDSAIRGAEGVRLSTSDALIRGYMNRVQWLTSSDPVAVRVFTQVGHLLRPPAVLFQPVILMKVLRSILARQS